MCGAPAGKAHYFNIVKRRHQPSATGAQRGVTYLATAVAWRHQLNTLLSQRNGQWLAYANNGSAWRLSYHVWQAAVAAA